jgi:hypothetical protein
MSGLQQIHQSVVGDALKAGFQNFVDQSATRIATAVAGTPAAGYFYSSIVGRAPIPDISADLRASLGVERIAVQSIMQLQNEFGSSGEPVFAAVNDDRGLIRFVGSWGIYNDSYGQRFYAGSASYIEVVFYGTGLNILSAANTGLDAVSVSYDGGGESVVNLNLATQSSIIGGRNYSQNTVVPVISALPLGVHTVKIRWAAGAGTSYQGFEILNATSGSNYININTGTAYIQGQKVLNSVADSITYSTGITGTKGGRVVRYLSADGTVSQAVTLVDTNSYTLANATHTNEEVVRTYHWREFGCGRNPANGVTQVKDDFSSLEGTFSDRAFTLDDGTTTLIAVAAVASSMNGKDGVTTSGTSNPITFTFVGTGLDIENTNNATSRPTTVIIDGVTLGSTFSPTVSAVSVQKIVSGLPYGTHTVKMQAVSGFAPITRFIVYQPKKPTIPTTAVELCDYNVMATYARSSTVGVASADPLSTGILFKSGYREHVYKGTWTGANVAAASLGGTYIITAITTDYVEYTFFGTGIEFHTSYAGSPFTATVLLDGSAYSGSATVAYNGGTVPTWTGGVFTCGGTNGASLQISSLTLGVHTVRLIKSTPTDSLYFTGVSVITPIHSTKSNLYADRQNTLTVGSCSLMDSRATSPIKEILPAKKAWAQAVGIAPAPTTTSTSAPIPDMSVTIKTSGGPIEVIYAVSAYLSASSSPAYFAPFVDGMTASGYLVVSGSSSSVATAGTCSGVVIVPVAAGTHKVDIYWGTDGGVTVTNPGTRRILTVREL